MADITAPSVMRQYSLDSNLARKNTSTGRDLREDLPVTIVLPGELKSKLSDVGGYEEAKIEIIEYVNYVNHQERYKKLGARLPKGALMVGPPGNGKTLLARAAAGAANIPFIAVSSGSLLLGNDGPAKLRRIFQLAYSMAPCVLFFDEVDCIGLDRNSELAKPETQSITEELLVQLDGFRQEDKLLIILASTNRKDALDDALVRPGRFDRIIKMPPPDLPSRVAIMKVHLSGIKTSLDKSMIAKRFSILAAGMTCAQIGAMCNEAAMIAARDLNEEVKMEHFEQALDRVRSGIKTKKAIPAAEKLRAAHHDAAHLIAGWYLEGAAPPTKLCILPNTKGEVECSQGNVSMPNVGKKAAMNLISTVLAGAAAEELLHHGEYTTSCSSDFKVASELALKVASQCGYSSTLGKVSMKTSHLFFAPGTVYNAGTKAYDLSYQEMKKTLDECYKKAKQIIKEKSVQLEKVAQLLVVKELVTLDMLVELLGPSPHMDMEKLNLADVDYLPAGMQRWNKSGDEDE